jgi:hypothetical protein
MGGPTSSIRYRKHSSWDHVTTQAPPLVKVGIPSGGGVNCTTIHISVLQDVRDG